MKQLASKTGFTDYKIRPFETIAEQVRKWREEGWSLVFTNGCFDLLHAGHVRYLQTAADFGDIFILGLNSDASVRKLKGPTRPIMLQVDRAFLLSALEVIDCVVIFDEGIRDSLSAVIYKQNPQVAENIKVRLGTSIDIYLQ